MAVPVADDDEVGAGQLLKFTFDAGTVESPEGGGVRSACGGADPAAVLKKQIGRASCRERV